MKRLFLLLLFIATYLLYHPNATHAQVIVTVAGNDTPGYSGDGGPATAAELYHPYGLALDKSGNLFISDELNRRVRRVSPAYGGTITTIAGTGFLGYNGDDIPAFHAQISYSYAVAVDNKGNLYIADAGNNRIRKVRPDDTIVTIAGTGVAGYNGDSILATSAELNNPTSLVVDSIGNIYIVDQKNYRIRKVDTFGIITTIVGTGIQGFSPDGSHADMAMLDSLSYVIINKNSEVIFTDNIRIRKLDTSGIITTIVGNGIDGYSGDGGPATAAEISVEAICIDKIGNLYLADFGNSRIRKIDTSGIITTIAGGGSSTADGIDPLLAFIPLPSGIAVDDSGDIYISNENHIRLITKHPNAVSTINIAQGIDIYPNPSDGSFTIHIASNINEPMQVAITNVLGVQLRTYAGSTNSPLQITSGLPPGIYLLSVTTESNACTQRLIIR